jgi:hypothetical protein
VSGDYGATWTSLASTLPAGQVVNCLTEDPRNGDVLYLGTESGLFVSMDRGGHWLPFKSNLPTVPIDEITIHPRDNDMLLATHGRSIWILDDLSPIQEAAEASRARAYLFDIDPAAELLVKNDFAGYPGDRSFWGMNPEPGASISWYLQDTVQSVGIAVRDSGGAVVRRMGQEDLSDPGTPGLHHVSWDLRHQPLESPAGAGRGGGSRFRRGSPGPFVLPGDYQVELTVDGSPAGTRTVHVSSDPRLRITEPDLVVLHDVTLWLHELQGVVNQVGVALDSAVSQVSAAQSLLEGSANPPARVRATADSLGGLLAGLTGELGAAPRMGFGRGGPGGNADALRNRIPALQRELMSWTGKVSATQLADVDRSGSDVGSLVARLNAVLTEGLPALHAALGDAGLNPPPFRPVPPIPFHPRLREEANGAH